MKFKYNTLTGRGSVDEDVHPVCRAGGDHVVVDRDGGLRRVDSELESLDEEREHDPSLEQRQVLAQAVPGPVDERVEVVDVKLLLEPLRPGSKSTGLCDTASNSNFPYQQTRGREEGREGWKEGAR